VQSLRDITEVWMNTVGLVFCNTHVCRKHGAKNASKSLFCIDPDYVAPYPTGSGKHIICYTKQMGLDWGSDAAHLRDDDFKLQVKMFYAVLRGEIGNAPSLFQPNQDSFTQAESNQFFGFSTMTENAKIFFKGDWWQWRKSDDVRTLLDDVPAVDTPNRCKKNREYSPYGRPEPREEASGDTAMTHASPSGSAETEPDDTADLGPSLGECHNMSVVTCILIGGSLSHIACCQAWLSCSGCSSISER